MRGKSSRYRKSRREFSKGQPCFFSSGRGFLTCGPHAGSVNQPKRVSICITRIEKGRLPAAFGKVHWGCSRFSLRDASLSGENRGSHAASLTVERGDPRLAAGMRRYKSWNWLGEWASPGARGFRCCDHDLGCM